MTGWRWAAAALALVVVVGARGAAGQCKGDFNGDDRVTIDELVTAVESALDGCDPGLARFVDNHDGTISDRRTGLMWEKKVGLDGVRDDAAPHDADNTYQWAGQCSPSAVEVFCQPTAAAQTLCPSGAAGCGGCADGQTCLPQPSGRSTVFEWAAALNAAAFAGHQDWRVPTLDEIESLVDRQLAAPSIDAAFAGERCGAQCTAIGDADCSCTGSLFYWSSTPVVSERPRAWTVRFDIGAVDGGAVNFDVNARAVRTE